MKNLIILVALIPLVMAGCKKKNTSSSNATEEQAKPSSELVLMTFSKSSCYGRCPAYVATIMPDGKIDFNSRANTPVVGSYTFQADVSFVEEVMSRANDINFFELEDKYDNEYVTDLPATVLTIEMTDKKKGVIARHEVPAQVTEFYTYIHEEIMKLAEERKKIDPTSISGESGAKKELPKAKEAHPYKRGEGKL